MKEPLGGRPQLDLYQPRPGSDVGLQAVVDQRAVLLVIGHRGPHRVLRHVVALRHPADISIYRAQVADDRPDLHAGRHHDRLVRRRSVRSRPNVPLNQLPRLLAHRCA